MAFEIEGRVHKIFPTEQKTDSFRAREFVIVVEDGQYPQYVKFQLTQDRTSLVDECNEGDQIKVHFDLRGREWKEKYFTNLNAWKVEMAQSGSGGSAPEDDVNFDNFFPPSNDSAGTKAPESKSDDFDDLPF